MSNSITTAAIPPSPSHPTSPTKSGRPIPSLNPFDLESGNQNSSIFVANNHNDGLIDWKRIDQVKQTIGLGGVGVSVALIVNAPASADIHLALYTTYFMFVCLGFFMGMGLSFFSVASKGSHVLLGRAQKRLIFFTLFFVVMACFLRFQLELPLDNIGFGTASVLTGILVIVLYLWLGWRCRRHMHDE